MLAYRDSKKLKVRKFARPEAPLWPGTLIHPYGGPSSAPVSIDVMQLRASPVERSEVDVADDVADLLSREQIQAPFRDPVVIDATGLAESVFRRGELAARHQLGEGSCVSQVISAEGTVPLITHDRFSLVISVWPFDPVMLEQIIHEAMAAELTWGVWVPLLYPVTTDIERLEVLADLVAKHGGAFLAAASIDVSQTAKSMIAREIDDEMDDEMYDVLFHADPEPLALATERHVAALAHERGLGDIVPLSGAEDRSNWRAAVLLTSAGSRLARMRGDPELGWTLLRSAAAIASLTKPLTIIAESAPLSIIEGLDPLGAESLEEWLRGEPPRFFEEVDAEWRLRRDAGWTETGSEDGQAQSP